MGSLTTILIHDDQYINESKSKLQKTKLRLTEPNFPRPDVRNYYSNIIWFPDRCL